MISSDMIRPMDLKSGWVIDGTHTLVALVGQTDLIQKETGEPAGRLADDDSIPPEGTEWLHNPRINKWWAKEPSGRIIGICLDDFIRKNRIAIP